MVIPDDLIITKHAQEKMIIEGIPVKQICEAIERGPKFQQSEGLLVKYRYFCVAYRKTRKKFIVKTVFLNR